MFPQPLFSPLFPVFIETSSDKQQAVSPSSSARSQAGSGLWPWCLFCQRPCLWSLLGPWLPLRATASLWPGDGRLSAFAFSKRENLRVWVHGCSGRLRRWVGLNGEVSTGSRPGSRRVAPWGAWLSGNLEAQSSRSVRSYLTCFPVNPVRNYL